MKLNKKLWKIFTVQCKTFPKPKKSAFSFYRFVFYFQTIFYSRNETNHVKRILKYFSLTSQARQLIKDLRGVQTLHWNTRKIFKFGESLKLKSIFAWIKRKFWYTYLPILKNGSNIKKTQINFALDFVPRGKWWKPYQCPRHLMKVFEYYRHKMN